ncbi:MAG: acyltransferase [Muribaculaceae bacterium]
MQVIRALSIIAVVMIHTIYSAELTVFCRPFINFAVATFIFLSGYLTKIEIDKPIAFWRKRIIRVLVPYIIWTVVYTFYASGVNLCAVVSELFTAQNTWHLYYILVYIQFVLLTPLLARLAKSRYMWIGICVSPLWVAVFLYLPNLGIYETFPNQDIIWRVSCFRWFSFYYLGLLLGNGIINRSFSMSRLSWLYAFAIILSMAESYCLYCMGVEKCGNQSKLTSLLSSLIFILMAYTYLRNDHYPQPRQRVLLSLGDYSFGIYLSHVMVILLLRKFDFYHFLPYPVNSVLVLGIAWAVVFLVSKVLPKAVSRAIGLR